jgi:hypothetical protein
MVVCRGLTCDRFLKAVDDWPKISTAIHPLFPDEEERVQQKILG